MLIGVIRVFSSDDAEIVEAHGKIIGEISNKKTKTVCIPDQPKGIYDDQSEQAALPKIMDAGIQLNEAGCEAIIISCAADPAVRELRERVAIPVFGAGSTAAYQAKAVGRAVGAMGITAEIPPAVKSVLGEVLIGYRQPDGVTNTTDLLTESGREAAISAARQLVEQGAEMILFACTGFATIDLKPVLKEALHVPVIDAVEAAGRTAALV